MTLNWTCVDIDIANAENVRTIGPPDFRATIHRHLELLPLNALVRENAIIHILSRVQKKANVPHSNTAFSYGPGLCSLTACIGRNAIVVK